MAAHENLDKRTRIVVKIPLRAVKDYPVRQFQVCSKPREIHHWGSCDPWKFSCLEQPRRRPPKWNGRLARS